MTTETTFAMIKPDGVKRALAGKIIQRFEECGLTIRAMELTRASRSRAEEHYGEHRGKYFYTPLIDLLTSGPVVILALEGACAVETVRKMVGATEPLKALPGTIRGDYCHMGYDRGAEKTGVMSNLIHASDSRVSAERELALWFGEEKFQGGYERYDAECF